LAFDGWRLDFAKGYSANIAKTYVQNASPSFVVAEIWSSLSYNGDGKPSPNQDHAVDALATTFDFTTKEVLQSAVQGELWRMRDENGKAPGMLGWWSERSVTFIDNHDTKSTQNSRPFPSDKVMEGYAYILTHPGVPCIVSAFLIAVYIHLFERKLRLQIH
jgi:alpha-amylase